VIAVATAWKPPSPRRFILDTVINIALYAPIGVFAHAVLAARKRVILSFIGPVVFGLLLSFSIEVAQVFTPSRSASALDVAANTLGAALGALMAASARAAVDLNALYRRSVRRADYGAAALLVCWLAFMFFPFVPILSSIAIRAKFGVLMDPAGFSLITFVSAAATWFVAGRLVSCVRLPGPGMWLGVVALIGVPLQAIILMRQPMLAELAGAAAGVALFIVLSNRLRSRAVDAYVMMSLLLFRGVAPFQLADANNQFSWVPFAGVLGYDWQYGFIVLLEKLFYYGAAIWALRGAGASLLKATLITTGTLAGIEAAQVHLRGRTPEITDVLLGIVVGITAAAFKRRKQGSAPDEVR